MGILEQRIAEGSANDEDQFELALLNLEPGHDGFRAVELLRGIRPSSPCHDLAQLWISHCLIYEMMDDGALAEAVQICSTLLGRSISPEVRTGAHFLRAMAVWNRNPTEAVIPDLCEAVRLEPDWSATRLSLARVYRVLHHERAAEEQLLAAREAAKKPAPEAADVPGKLFELMVTGRGGHRRREWIDEELERLKSGRDRPGVR